MKPNLRTEAKVAWREKKDVFEIFKEIPFNIHNILPLAATTIKLQF